MTYEWAVIGAGPAGIAAVGKLIDAGINPKDILWVDPNFSVGDFGRLWGNIPSNTKVKLFLKFLHNVKAFNYQNCPHDFKLNHANDEETCYLGMVTEPLRWVTKQLLSVVQSLQDTTNNISQSNRCWHLHFKNCATKSSKNVILAIGAEPKKLSYPLPEIPLQDAMDSERIQAHVGENDTIAVFGSSHSAILVLRNLCNIKVKSIINFYRSPLRYAVYLDDWILFDDSGLKGTAAVWARQHIDGDIPKNMTRVYANEANIEHYLPQSDKAIYAVGFEHRTLPIVENLGHISYLENCGIIAPGLFGIGIAFPQAKVNELEILEYRVGLWKFIEYLDEILPIWLKYPA